jgi:hypothetical protein
VFVMLGSCLKTNIIIATIIYQVECAWIYLFVSMCMCIYIWDARNNNNNIFMCVYPIGDYLSPRLLCFCFIEYSIRKCHICSLQMFLANTRRQKLTSEHLNSEKIVCNMLPRWDNYK